MYVCVCLYIIFPRMEIKKQKVNIFAISRHGHKEFSSVFSRINLIFFIKRHPTTIYLAPTSLLSPSIL